MDDHIRVDLVLPDLCLKLYKASGWDGTYDCWEQSDGIPAGKPYLVQPVLIQQFGLWSTQEVKKRYPAYSVGYMLSKLPRRIDVHFDMMDGETRVYAYYGQEEELKPVVGETPAEALCKLCLQLYELKVLTRK